MLAYCDYIAERIKRCLGHNDPQCLIGAIGQVKWHLNKDGVMVTTKKTIDLSDINGKKYRITVVEL